MNDYEKLEENIKPQNSYNFNWIIICRDIYTVFVVISGLLSPLWFWFIFKLSLCFKIIGIIGIFPFAISTFICILGVILNGFIIFINYTKKAWFVKEEEIEMSNTL